eukprot:NODE_48_length_31852_cov_1.054168.p3 type:complete len:741 gc:universal NODE_48_length_31852_cov_1.054168:18252-20474(+)
MSQKTFNEKILELKRRKSQVAVSEDDFQLTNKISQRSLVTLVDQNSMISSSTISSLDEEFIATEDRSCKTEEKSAILQVIDSYLEEIELELSAIYSESQSENSHDSPIKAPENRLTNEFSIVTKGEGYVINTTEIKVPKADLVSMVKYTSYDQLQSQLNYPYPNSVNYERFSHQSGELSLISNSEFEEVPISKAGSPRYMSSTSRYFETEEDETDSHRDSNSSAQDIFPNTKPKRATLEDSSNFSHQLLENPTRFLMKKKNNSRYPNWMIIIGVFMLLFCIILAILVPILNYKKSCYNNLDRCRDDFLAKCKSQLSCSPDSVLAATMEGCRCIKVTCSCLDSNCSTKFVDPSIINNNTNVKQLSSSIEFLDWGCSSQAKLFNLKSDFEKSVLAFYSSISPNMTLISSLSSKLITNTNETLIFDDFKIDFVKKTINFQGNSNESTSNRFNFALEPLMTSVYSKAIKLSELKSNSLLILFQDLGLNSEILSNFKYNFLQSNILLSVNPNEMLSQTTTMAEYLTTDPILHPSCISDKSVFTNLSPFFPDFKFEDCNLRPHFGTFNWKRIRSGDVQGSLKQLGMFVSSSRFRSVVTTVDPNDPEKNSQNTIGFVDHMDHVIFDFFVGLKKEDAIALIKFVLEGDPGEMFDNSLPKFLYTLIFDNLKPADADAYAVSLTTDGAPNSSLLISSSSLIQARNSLKNISKPLILTYKNESAIDSPKFDGIWQNLKQNSPENVWAKINN